MARTKTMKQMEEKLRQIRHEIALLQEREALLVEMIGEANGEATGTPPAKKRAPRSNVKRTVLDLLEMVKHNGLNAATAVQMAKDEKGVDLDRGSVSSLLSRLKHEGTVTFVEGKYRLREYSPSQQAGDDTSAAVHPLRTSGVAS